MPALTRVVSEVASEMALVPLAWTVLLALRTKRMPGAAWWWLTLAFAVSWVADFAALWVDPWFVGVVYPVSQAALVGVVFLSRIEAAQLVGALVAVAIADLLWHGIAGPDLLLRTVAWGAAAGIVVDRLALGRLRTALLVSFGVGLITWWGYAIWPGWTSWLLYQATRASGITLFCLAALQPRPRLALATRGA